VADYLDECPLLAGIVALKGCPDSDGDGVADIKDACPEVAGLLNLDGCPDSDGDGVADKDDKCANTKAGYKVDATGCPMDKDGDSVIDEEDDCPDQSGSAVLKGCPDRDGDGIADKNDKCPDVVGIPANNGCPELPKEIITQITKIASKIFFESGSDKLKPSSRTQLDDLADILNKYAEADLIVEGHTDNTGDAEKNVLLSEKRCESVKTYLISKGIDGKRLTTTGYGQTRPLDDNTTAAGRAKNRRVELKTQY
jgi:outer membrane protein OmpA-like peptidoglycan-associated protein